MSDFFNNLISNLVFIFERFSWLSVLDVLLVAAVFFAFLLLLRGTQAMVLLRGAILLVALLGLLTSLDILPAFSWLVRTTFPALLFAIPVIFAPEIRHALERLGRAGFLQHPESYSQQMQDAITAIVSASCSPGRPPAWRVDCDLGRRADLTEYVRTGVKLDARVTPELLLQIFYPNTPLHDGAVVISGAKNCGCILCHAAFCQWSVNHIARTPDGITSPRRPGYFRSKRCHRCGGIGRNRINFRGTRWSNDPAD